MSELIKLQPTQESALQESNYAGNRVAEYPSVEVQLDMIYHSGVLAGTEWEASIKAVKDKYPKE